MWNPFEDLLMPGWARRLEITMARIEDKINELNGVLESIGSGVQGVQGDVTTLGTEITALKEQLANSGDLSPEQEAAFDAAISKARSASDALTALDAMNPATPEPSAG